MTLRRHVISGIIEMRGALTLSHTSGERQWAAWLWTWTKELCEKRTGSDSAARSLLRMNMASSQNQTCCMLVPSLAIESVAL